MALTEWPQRTRLAHRPIRRGHRWISSSDVIEPCAARFWPQHGISFRRSDPATHAVLDAILCVLECFLECACALNSLARNRSSRECRRRSPCRRSLRSEAASVRGRGPAPASRGAIAATESLRRCSTTPPLGQAGSATAWEPDSERDLRWKKHHLADFLRRFLGFFFFLCPNSRAREVPPGKPRRPKRSAISTNPHRYPPEPGISPDPRCGQMPVFLR